ncbi:MAG TPA: hypothetical protein VJ023_07830 [Pyrinomonadaceae bacterium]|nr:hypothetical protein [Pyrinomonadaceae bacterium]
MKRCPQCEFIYEEDQSLCDLDGFELVHDSLALVPVPTTPRKRSRRVSWAALTLAFAAVFLLGFVIKPTNVPEQSSASITSEKETEPAVGPAPDEPPSDEITAIQEEQIPRKDLRSRSKRTNSTRGESRKPVRTTAQVAPSTKKDSKVESAIKKTGRFLKKPFKF